MGRALGSGLHEQRRAVARRDFTWYLLADKWLDAGSGMSRPGHYAFLAISRPDFCSGPAINCKHEQPKSKCDFALVKTVHHGSIASNEESLWCME
jgi:hypothetical protein